jgi:hypothetical protein
VWWGRPLSPNYGVYPLGLASTPVVSSQIVVRPFQQAPSIPWTIRLSLISRQARRILQLPVIADYVKPATVVQQHRANSLNRTELEDAHQTPAKRREYTRSVQPDASPTPSALMQRVEFTPHQIPQRIIHVVMPSFLVGVTLFGPALQL